MNNTKEERGSRTAVKHLSYMVALMGLNLSLFLSALVMTGMAVAGMWKLGLAAYTGIMAGTLESGEEPMHTALSGLEFLFLAPLGYFVTWTVLKYIMAIAPYTSEAGKSPGQAGAQALNREAKLLKARAEMLLLKAFNVSLYIAIISTYLVGKTLSKEGIEYKNVICGLSVIVVLGTYFFMLERAGMHLSEQASILPQAFPNRPDSEKKEESSPVPASDQAKV